MRRSALAVLAAAALALAIPTAALSDGGSDPVHGPDCSDIQINNDLAYVSNAELGVPPTVQGTMEVTSKRAKPTASCPGAVYQVVVTDYATGAQLASQTFTGDGTTASWSINMSQPAGQTWPDTVCVAATSAVNNKIADYIPNTGCIPLALNVSGGQSVYG